MLIKIDNMFSLTDIKRIKIRVLSRPLKPLIARMDKAGIRPNQLTAISAAFCICGVVLLAYGKALIGGIFIILDIFFDMLDGALARYQGRPSRLRELVAKDAILRPLYFVGAGVGGFVSWPLAAIAIFITFALETLISEIIYLRLRMKFMPHLANLFYLCFITGLIHQVTVMFIIYSIGALAANWLTAILRYHRT
jgi:phosphatidylglycerophosphate synthase